MCPSQIQGMAANHHVIYLVPRYQYLVLLLQRKEGVQW